MLESNSCVRLYSKDLLPKPFQELMTEKSSPIFDYYPLEFRTDLNGKKNDWEAVVLIPFIDEVSTSTFSNVGEFCESDICYWKIPTQFDQLKNTFFDEDDLLKFHNFSKTYHVVSSYKIYLPYISMRSQIKNSAWYWSLHTRNGGLKFFSTIFEF